VKIKSFKESITYNNGHNRKREKNTYKIEKRKPCSLESDGIQEREEN
jgi:hypothetical protein